MDLSYTDEQRAFRDEVRCYIAERLPVRLSDKVRLGTRLTKEDYESWHAILAERGWLAGAWPEAFGGQGWNAVRRHIFEEETTRAAAPRIVPFGVAMLGPVLQRFGSKAQQERWLPRILDGSDRWCQGYSEPGAGSDLASLATSAVRDGDHYVVNGQKTWTTLGQHANMNFCLVRTDREAKAQEGISFLHLPQRPQALDLRRLERDPAHDHRQVRARRGRVVNFELGEERQMLQDSLRRFLRDRYTPELRRALGEGPTGFSAELWSELAGLGVVGALFDEALGGFGGAGFDLAVVFEELGRVGAVDPLLDSGVLGSFQALQHRMADLSIEIEQARSAVINLAGHVDAPRDERERHVSATKHLVGEVGRLVAEEGIQLHGGIGMTMEYELGHLARRLVMTDHRFGDTTHHLERFIAFAAA